MVKLINCFIVSLFLILTSLFIIPQHTLASTTLYFGSIEKTYDDTGAVVEEKVYIPAGNSMAVKQTTINNQQSTIYYLHSDHIGSTVLVSKDDGTIESSLAYYPYGNSTDLNNESRIMNQDTDKLYTSQRKDESTNLYFYNARYYNPTTGRFLSADKAQGPNRYAYVGNNPVERNDPTGNQEINVKGVLDNLINQAKQYAQTEIDWCANNLDQCSQKYSDLYKKISPQQPANNQPKPVDIKPEIKAQPLDMNKISPMRRLNMTDAEMEYYAKNGGVNFPNSIQIQPDAGKQSNSANKLKAYYLTVPPQSRKVVGKDFTTSPYVTYRGVIPEYSGTNYNASACTEAGGSPMSAQNACQGELNHAFTVMKDDPRSSQSLKNLIDNPIDFVGAGRAALTALGMGECTARVPANGCYSSPDNNRFEQVVLDEKQSERFTQQHPELIPQ